jgi:hypothetical protein
MPKLIRFLLPTAAFCAGATTALHFGRPVGDSPAWKMPITETAFSIKHKEQLMLVQAQNVATPKTELSPLERQNEMVKQLLEKEVEKLKEKLEKDPTNKELAELNDQFKRMLENRVYLGNRVVVEDRSEYFSELHRKRDLSLLYYQMPGAPLLRYPDRLFPLPPEPKSPAPVEPVK